MSEQYLAECPFCGGTDIHITRQTQDPGYFTVQCQNPDCCALMEDVNSAENAAFLWNHRPAESALREEIRELTMMSPSEICGKYHIQNCHVCENDACCDNTNPAISALRKRVGELEEANEDAYMAGYEAGKKTALTTPAEEEK